MVKKIKFPFVGAVTLCVASATMSLGACQNENPVSQTGLVTEAEQLQRPSRVIKDEVSGQAPVKLSLSKEKVESGKISVNLNFAMEEGRDAPRMAEVYLKMSDNLKFIQAQPGSVAAAANKDVIAQAREAQQVRVTIFSSGNLNTLSSGQWAVLEFEVIPGDASEASVEIVQRDAMLAPPVSGEGLELGAPLVLAL